MLNPPPRLVPAKAAKPACLNDFPFKGEAARLKLGLGTAFQVSAAGATVT